MPTLRRVSVSNPFPLLFTRRDLTMNRPYDAVFDFDAAVRDATEPWKLRARVDPGDHAHPNDKGNEAMAAVFDPAALLR